MSRETRRPVKLVLSRKQMYLGTGYRPSYAYRLRLGSDGRGPSDRRGARAGRGESSYEKFTESVLAAHRSSGSLPGPAAGLPRAAA
ncbi:hypothetical protein [Streptomyces sp. AK04-3B]|uniref:hypothetical protein n=1 Tax=Streptomyces sp. AK04-3B TaxID=3028650 RepID=UPI0029B9E214|nr:hypothetical protein [Streptomyces sp. AK04-3B]MDX3802556.1 hypothetical protein [Streptomyces sp. AK04-3B]